MTQKITKAYKRLMQELPDEQLLMASVLLAAGFTGLIAFWLFASTLFISFIN